MGWHPAIQPDKRNGGGPRRDRQQPAARLLEPAAFRLPSRAGIAHVPEGVAAGPQGLHTSNVEDHLWVLTKSIFSQDTFLFHVLPTNKMLLLPPPLVVDRANAVYTGGGGCQMYKKEASTRGTARPCF